ncbi:response regulator transcription factor [Candidatus Woesebacteria bacterium]|nr:response regulator transcription factor [Candidatus Woesebacteria bacterium]
MRILVVEDEHRIAAALKKGLEQEQFAVDLAYKGTDGYDLAVSEEYDLIILDLMLPELDGLSVCKKLRSESINTPILMLTARGQIEDKVTGLNVGADDYLTKPFSFDELLARVRALMRRPTQTMPSILTIGDLTLNPISFSIQRGDAAIKLSSKEFALLEYLMRHPNTILSKQQLIEHVWNYDADILPNTVEVYMKNLRSKLDQPFPDKPQLLHTVRGFGYKIGEIK